jgi:hypothetical protein
MDIYPSTFTYIIKLFIFNRKGFITNPVIFPETCPFAILDYSSAKEIEKVTHFQQATPKPRIPRFNCNPRHCFIPYIFIVKHFLPQAIRGFKFPDPLDHKSARCCARSFNKIVMKYARILKSRYT